MSAVGKVFGLKAPKVPPIPERPSVRSASEDQAAMLENTRSRQRRANMMGRRSLMSSGSLGVQSSTLG